MREVGILGDHDLVLDGITGASKREIRHAERIRAEHATGNGSFAGSYAFSDENDYTSHGFAVSGSREFNQRNTTFSADASWTADDFHPRGVFAGLGGRKDIESLSLGLFQTLTRYSLAGMTIEYIRSDGYLGHPYLPVITESGGLILERTPRMRNSLAATASWIQGYRFWERLGSVHLKLGAYGDDWGLQSQSCEAQWHQYLRGTLAVRVRMRFYQQDAAAFAREHYSGREAYRVADIRYFGFRTLSGGLRVSGGFPDSFAEWLPDRWDIGYDQGTRDTRGEEGTGEPFRHYQLFPASEYYQEGRLLAGLGFDW
jgi:hypothetical protein